MKTEAIEILMRELEKGESAAADSGWIDESDILAEINEENFKYSAN